MSRFDDLRQKIGIEPTNQTSSKPTLKSTNFSTRSVTPAYSVQELRELAQSSTVQENPIQSTPSRRPIKGPLEMDDPMGTPAESDYDRQKREAREIPVIGKVLKGLDWVGKKTDPVAEIARSFYIPGSGLANIAGLTGAAENAVSRLAPKLGNSVLGRIGQKAASEAIVGAPLGVAQTQMVSPDASTSDILKGAAWGVGGGAVLGGLGKGIGEALRYGRESAESFANNAFRQASEPTLALPQGRRDSRLDEAMRRGNNSYGSDPIVNPYTFGLPKATDATITRTKNVDDAFKSMKDIDDELTSLDSQYQQAINDQYQLLKQQRNERGGVQQGQLITDGEGVVTGRVGRISNNPTWYQDFYREHGKVPSNKDLYKLAQKHVDEGYTDNGIDIPSWKQENGYQETKDSLAAVREEIRHSIKEKGLNLTDAKLKDQRLKGLNKPAPSSPKLGESPLVPEKASPTVEPVIQQPEPVPNVRRNFKNQQENGNFSDDFRNEQNKRDLTYEPITNKETLEKVNERFSNESLDDIRASFQKETKELSAEHTLTGYRLMQQLDQTGRYEDAVNVAEKLAADLTKAGQTVQAASVLKRLSPEGQLLHLVRTAENSGKKVTPKDYEKYKELAGVRQKGLASGSQTAKFYDLLDDLKAGKNVSADDLRSSVENMLAEAKKNMKPEKAPKEVKPRVRDKVLSYLEREAEAAKKELLAKRNLGFAAKLGTPDVVLYSKIYAHELAKKAINIADFTELLVKQSGENLRPYAKEIYDRANKLIGRADKQVGPDKVKIIEKFLKEGTFKPEDEKALRNIASQINDLTGKKGKEADMQMQKILNSYEKSTVWGKVQAIRYIAMLLNSSTQAVNALSGPIMATTGTISDILPAMVDSVMNKVLKTPRTTTLYGTNPLRFTADWFKNAYTGGKAGFQGVNPSGIQGANEIRGLAFKSPYNPLGIAERSLGAVSKGADYGTYKTVFDSEIVKQGYLDAVNKGIKGKDNIKAHIEKFKIDPPEEAVLQADRIGKNTTFQRSDTTGGKLANYLNSAPKIIEGPARTIFPFVRTPVNIASTAVTLTPGGIIKGLYQLSSKSDATRREALRTLGMGLTGTGIGAVGYYLSQLGIITGANDSGDKDVDAVREQAGKGKYRFNTSALSRYLKAMISGEGAEAAEKAAKYQKGDKQFDYNKLQPLAFPAAIGASLENNKDNSTTDQIRSAGLDSLGSLVGMSSLKGLQDTFQPQYGGSQGEKQAGIGVRLAESFFKSFSPSALAQEARRQDPIQRKVSFNDGFKKDVTDYFKSRTPGLSKSLPANKTTLGQNKLNADGVVGQYANPYKSDVAPYNDAAKLITELMDRTGDMSIAPKAPTKTVEGKDKLTKKHVSGVPIPQERYAQLQEEVGNEIIKKVSALDPSLSDDKKIVKIKEIYSDVNEKARNKVKKELGIMVQ